MDVREVIRGHRGAMVAMAAASTVGGVAEAGVLVLATRVALALSRGEHRVDLVGGRDAMVATALWLALALVVVRFALAAVSNRIAAGMAVRATSALRRDLADAYLHASWAHLHEDRIGRLQELMTGYTVGGANAVNGIAGVVTSAFGLVAMLGLAVAVHPLGALVVIVAVSLLGTALRPVRRRIRRRSEVASDAGMAFATGVGEVATVGLELQAYGVQEAWGRRVDALIDEGERTNRRLFELRGIVPHLYVALAFVAVVAALALATRADTGDVGSLGAVMLVMLRSLSYGQALQQSVAVVTTTTPYLDELDAQIRGYRDARAVDGGEPVGEVGALELRGVSFAYRPDAPVLTDVDLRIEPRSVVGLVGASGGGKSTLVQLLVGLRAPTSGTVLAGGRPLGSLSRAEWVRRVAFVPQAPHLVRGSVADNIRFLREGISDAQVEQAARLAHLHDEIVAFPGGYAHEVGEGGGRLSGGQQQRLSIARALVGDPEVLVLDEPTSALDPRSEELIRQTLAELAHRMTIVLVAHRPSTLEACDEVHELRDGALHAKP